MRLKWLWTYAERFARFDLGTTPIGAFLLARCASRGTRETHMQQLEQRDRSIFGKKWLGRASLREEEPVPSCVFINLIGFPLSDNLSEEREEQL
jgi:hypothetical protein